MAVLTVSRQLGSRGNEIAVGVAERLSLRLVDREVIHQAAQEAGVPHATLMELSYEGQRSLIERVLDIVNTMPVISQVPHASRRETTVPMALPLSNILTPAAPVFTQSMGSYVRVVEQIIHDLADQGNVMIVGRGGQMILRGRDDTLHVHIIAPFDQRVETVMQRENVGRREARARVAASDRARSEYIRRFYQAQWSDPTLYDLVINTDKIDMLAGIELIVRAQMAVKATSKSWKTVQE